MFLTVVVVVALVAVYHLAVFAFIAATWYAFTHLGIITYIVTHPWQSAAYAAGYFVVGAAWSVAKWWFAETSRVRHVRSLYVERYSDQTLKGFQTWAEFIKPLKSRPSQHKADITAWITFWPVSLVWTMVDDPVRRLCRRIYDELQGVYQRITDRVWQQS
jgi:hypothetical protein